MTDTIFPIKSKTACLLKWSWSTVLLHTGMSSSCHRVTSHAIDPNNFSNFHNLPEKITARKTMLEGQWPGLGCEYCKNIEDAGGLSDRQSYLNDEFKTKWIPPELHHDPTATAVTPTILEVYFKNTCNMSCVYCGPNLSSKWVDENTRYSPADNHDVKYYQFFVSEQRPNPHYQKMVADLWNYLKTNNNAKTLQRFHILGGEPFLLDELDQCIDFWQEHGHSQLTIGIISNINIPHEKFKYYINQFEVLAKTNKMKQLNLTASLDGWSKDQEYVRYGLDLAVWEKNFQYLLNKPWIAVSINSTISALTIKSLPSLIQKIQIWNEQQQDIVDRSGQIFQNKIWHSFNASTVQDSLYFFSGDIFQKDFAEVLDLMPTTTQSHIINKQVMAGISLQSSKSFHNIEKIAYLKDYLTELDRRRKTNWKQIFPWLEQIKT